MKEPMKPQDTAWWIVSIAVSVVCCSALFILFASYLVELKSDIRSNNARITAGEARDRMMAHFVTLHAAPAETQEPAAVALPAAPAPAADTIIGSTAPEPVPGAAPLITPPNLATPPVVNGPDSVGGAVPGVPTGSAEPSVGTAAVAPTFNAPATPTAPSPPPAATVR